MVRISPLLLFWKLDSASAGLYAAAVAMVSPILVLPGVLGGLLRPRGATMDREAAIDQVGTVVRIVTFAAVIASLVGVFVAHWIVLVFAGRDFLEAVPALQIFLISVPFRSATVLLVSYLAGAGKPESEVASSVLGAITVAILCVTLIPVVGLKAAAIADVAGAFVCMMVVGRIFCRKTGGSPLGLMGLRKADLTRLVSAIRTIVFRKVTL